jgi:hypothetical protein
VDETVNYLNMVGFARDELSKAPETSLNRRLHGYLGTLDSQFRGASFHYNPPTPIEMLDEVLKDINEEAKKRDPHALTKMSFDFASFVLSIFGELRIIICGKGKQPKKLGKEWHAILTGLAALIAQKLGLSDPASIAFAVLVLITLAQATKNAFCKMSDSEVYFALRGPRH